MMTVHHDERANAEFWPDCASLAEEAAVFLRKETRDPEDGGAGGSGGDRTRILLPYDDTEAAHRALESTRELAAGLNASVRVIHVRTWDLCRGGRMFLETREESLRLTRAALVRLRREGIAAAGVIRIAKRTRVPDEILAEARSFGANAIVLGARRRRLLASLLLGSVSHSVLRRANCPVILVHPTDVGDPSPGPGDHGDDAPNGPGVRRPAA
jgi:nucleotide-binding universal stress UspA family protein